MSQIRAYSYLRFSTPQQLLGDSQRRQLEASRRWCEKHSAELVEEMQDLGISAFRGKNRMIGALGRFLQLVKAGEIPASSHLIVENIDRLSRDDVLPALKLYMDIILGGVTIVTLIDEQVHSQKSIQANPMILQMAIASMARGNEESRVKSRRILSAWAESRRLGLAGKPFPMGRPPCWLKRNKSDGYDVNEKRAAAVKLVFDLYAGGFGISEITTRLNKEKLPPLTKRGKTGVWRTSAVGMILRSKTVTGTLVVKEKGEKVGEVADFYPRIVSDDVYAKVQTMIRHRTTKTARKSGGSWKSPQNAFSGVARDIEGGGVQYVCNKYKSKKTGEISLNEYLRAGKTFDQGLGTRSFSWFYRDFQDIFVATCRLAMKGSHKTTEEEGKLAIQEERIAGAREARENFLKALETADEGHAFLAGQVDAKTKEIGELEDGAEDLRNRIRSAKTKTDSLPAGVELDREKLRRVIDSNVQTLAIDFEKKSFEVVLFSGVTYSVRLNKENRIFVTTDDFKIPSKALADVKIRQKWDRRFRRKVNKPKREAA